MPGIQKHNVSKILTIKLNGLNPAVKTATGGKIIASK